MIVFFQRFDKAGKLHTIRGNLSLSVDGKLCVYFTGGKCPPIELNDGNEHELTELNITVLKIYIDLNSIYVKGFVQLSDGKIHKDAFNFYTDDPTT
jgi:hypothetical protein